MQIVSSVFETRVWSRTRPCVSSAEPHPSVWILWREEELKSCRLKCNFKGTLSISHQVLVFSTAYCNSQILPEECQHYRAVTIQSPRVTLAAKSTLPPSKMKNPIRSFTSLSPITEVRVASRNEFKIHWPSKAKQGTALTIARAPEREIRYLVKSS